MRRGLVVPRHPSLPVFLCARGDHARRVDRLDAVCLRKRTCARGDQRSVVCDGFRVSNDAGTSPTRPWSAVEKTCLQGWDATEFIGHASVRKDSARELDRVFDPCGQFAASHRIASESTDQERRYDGAHINSRWMCQ